MSEPVVVAAAADVAPAQSHNDAVAASRPLPNSPAGPADAPKSTGLHSPPDSNNAVKFNDDDDSELSDLDDASMIDVAQPSVDPTPTHPSPEGVKDDEPEDDIGEVVPDHVKDGVPIFKPTMHQFKDFTKFMEKVDSYGMKSGIIKIIPPEEWKNKLPDRDELVKQVTVRQPIKQEIMGSSGTYRQVNILHQRSYNLPQWKQLCNQSEHQPPARRGERRAQPKPAPKPRPAPRTASASTSKRPTRSSRRGKKGGVNSSLAGDEDRPMTPVSPKADDEGVVSSVEQEPDVATPKIEPDAPTGGRMGGGKQPKAKTQSTSARRKFATREGSVRIDEEAFKDFDYQMDISGYTPERCEELERVYWKTLTYAPPLYGADLCGTMFDDDTDTWNLSKLPNLLDVLGTKVPGVNTAYLYLGMWKATFAWHLEDVDLYSINFLHFGAPKQWYSISQGDARRFEAAMKSIWPSDAKACDQFLRHKSFLISPNKLLDQFNIKVNKCVSYPGEFVVTYPYGYHSGYNLGYNCAEAVNFALDSWLPMGKIAKRCECAQAQDSVWVDVYEIERKLRGEETDYEETEDEEEEEEDEEDIEEPVAPVRSIKVKIKPAGRKRKRATKDNGESKKAKKIRLRVKAQVETPCCLCPHDIPGFELLPSEDGRRAHRLCALYGPETWIETDDNDKEVVANVANISKARTDLKCLNCRSKKGACFQCSHQKCHRAYHATCAAAAGVLVEEQEVPVFGVDGTEYKEQAFEFTCRFHRTKRDKKADGDALEDCTKIQEAAASLKKGDICQFQFFRGEIFGGVVVENRVDEETAVVDILPHGDRVEAEWKWLLLPDPADFRLPKASPKALPMPTSRKAKAEINATKREGDQLPRAGDSFGEGFTWAELNMAEVANRAQVKVNLSDEHHAWHYLGRTSTEARAQYTENPLRPVHNPRSNYLDTLPKPPPPPQPRKSFPPTFNMQTPEGMAAYRAPKPYQYKPKNPTTPSFIPSPYTSQQFTPAPMPYTTQQFTPRAFTYVPQPMAPPQNYPTPGAVARYSQGHAQSPVVPYTPPSWQQQASQQPQPRPQPASLPPSTSGAPISTTPIPLPVPPTTVPPTTAAPTTAAPTTAAPTTAAPTTATASPVPVPVPAVVVAPTTTPVPTPPQTHALAQPQPPPPPNTIQKPATPKPTPVQHGHTRNSRSVHVRGSPALAFGPGFRHNRSSSVSYGATRYDTNGKSPFSHGFMQPPGLGTMPSPQNGQLFQAQARARSNSAASNRSFSTPMTSSAIRPSSSASSQGQVTPSRGRSMSRPTTAKPPKQSIIQKYAFFRINHNRDSTTYRTPYSSTSGFTNGYEGDLQAHLKQFPDALLSFGRPETVQNSSSARYLANKGVASGTPRPSPPHNSGIPLDSARPPHAENPVAAPKPSSSVSAAQSSVTPTASPAPTRKVPSGTGTGLSSRGSSAAPSPAVKAKPVPTKQTFVPPPRPWETLRKTQPASSPGSAVNPPVSPAAPSSAAPSPSPVTVPSPSPSATAVTPVPPPKVGHFISSEYTPCPNAPPQGLATLSTSTTYNNSAGAPYGLGPGPSNCQSHSSAPSAAQPAVPIPQPISVTPPQYAEMKPPPTMDREFPEVPEGSVDLIENIIKSAREASARHSTNG